MKIWVIQTVFAFIVKYLKSQEGSSVKLPKSQLRVVLISERHYIDHRDALIAGD